MVIKKEKTETEKTIEEMKLPKWLDDLITKKWFFYVATAVVLVLFVGFSLPANTRDNIANAIFAKTADSSAALEPPSGSGNPPIVGAATPTPTPGQEKTKTAGFAIDYAAKLEADRKGSDLLSQRIQAAEGYGRQRLIPVAGIPKKIQINEVLDVWIVGLTVSPTGKITGTLDNRENTIVRISAAFYLYSAEYEFSGATGVKIKDGTQRTLDLLPGEKLEFVGQIEKNENPETIFIQLQFEATRG